MQPMTEDLKTIKNKQAALREIIRDFHDGNSKRFAESIGVRPNTVSRWQSDDYENGDSFRPIPDKRCRDLELRYNKPRYWMDQYLDKNEHSSNTGTTVLQGPRAWGEQERKQEILKLPKLDSNQACRPTESIAGGEGVEYFPVGTAVCSENSFFYTVEDDSMVRDGHKSSLPRGTDLIVDMNEKPVPGDVVLASLSEGGPAAPRLFKDNGGGRYALIPLNDFYPTSESAQIIGVVMSVNIPLRARR